MRTALKVINCSEGPDKVSLFMIEDFPAVPRQGDFMDVPEMVRPYCDAVTMAEFEELTWMVDHILWCQDEEGIYPEVVCRCLQTPA